MPVNVNAVLSGASLQVIDTAFGVQRVGSAEPAVSAAAQAAFYDSYFQVSTIAANVAQPFTPIWVLWIKNLSATATINVTLTPAGGTPWAQPLVLVPGQVFAYWAPYTINPASGGIILVNLSASANNTPAEILLAG